MGAAFGNTCYPDLASAQDAYFQAVAPVFLPSGNAVSYQLVTGVWNRVETPPSGSATLTSAALPSLASCDSMQGFNDGISLSVAMTLAIISASLYGIISKAK